MVFSADQHEEDSKHSDQRGPKLSQLDNPLPITVFDRNISLGLYYQRKYDFSRKFKLQYNPSTVFPGDYEVLNEFSSSISSRRRLSTITAALAFEVTNRLSLGIALNYWHNTLLRKWLDADPAAQAFSQKGSSLFDFSKSIAE